jgi:hypothetical protein
MKSGGVTFGSSTISLHVIRGILGLAALYACLAAVNRGSWLWLGLLPVALVSLKGCPLCWTIGLVETIARTLGKSRRL